MLAVIDGAGRVLVPKSLRTALGLEPGTTVDISAYGGSIQITPGGRTAQLVRDSGGRLVAEGTGSLDDATVFALIDAGRR